MIRSLFITGALSSCLAVQTVQAQNDAERISAWHDGERHDFSVDGRAAILVCPQKEAPGRPWIWRMEFFDHEPQADAALLARGWHVAYLNVQNLFGAPKALDAMDVFYDRMVNGRGLADKVALEGFSRGGLFSLNWAARHPDQVSSIYNDAPVCDITTWPKGQNGGKESNPDWQTLLKVYGITEEEAMSGKYSPVNHLEPLAKAKIPLLHVCGDADEVVPFPANTGVLEKRYKELGGEISVIAKPGVKHHPHSLSDPAPIVDFATAHFKPASGAVAAGLSRPEKIDPALPDVLIIGDSISIGYTPDTKKLLAGKANVWRTPVNGSATITGAKYLDDWLQGRKWRVIHFNWGLHDLKYIGSKGVSMVEAGSPGAHHQVEAADYEKNLTALCTRLKATGARLIWAETTPVPPGAKGRVEGDEKLWNEAAARVMQAAAVPVNPLWAHAAAKPEGQRKKDVHFTKDGYAHLAVKVAEAVGMALGAVP